MSYEVTATRLRPQTFDQLVGQEFVVSTLKNSISKERIAHAYLFSGPRGVGKTSAARILAKSLNCSDTTTSTPCGTCSNCISIQRGNSLDVFEIDGASNTSVNDIRAIKDEIQFAPNSATYKIYIIDEVHMLSNSAFNALLKTIEEPPEHIIFIFATTEVHKVPATIRSRCQQFHFRLLSVELTKELLEKAAEELNLPADEDALYWIANEATGSMRDAYTLFDQVVSFSEGKITYEQIKDKLGLVGQDEISELIGAFLQSDHESALLLFNSILQRGIAIEQFLINLSEYYRNLLFIKAGIKRTSVLGRPINQFNLEASEVYTVPQLEHALNRILSVYKDLRLSLNQRFETELLISELCSLGTYITSSQLLKQVREIKGEIYNSGSDLAAGNSRTDRSIPDNEQPTENPSQEPSEDMAADPSGRESDDGEEGTGSFSEQLIMRVRKQKLSLASVIEQALSIQLEKDTLTFSFPNPFQVNVVRKELGFLSGILEEITGKKITIDFNVQEQNNDDKPVNAQVDTIAKVFRGEIVGEE